jgi:hypothetical protein
MQYTIPRDRGGKLSTMQVVLTAADGSIHFITIGASNTAAHDYAAWLKAGNTPTPSPLPPAPPPVLSYLQFRALFTVAENAAIMTAAQQNHAVLDWLLQAAGAGRIDLADAAVKAGLDALVAAGLLTSARETAILANQAP